MPINSGLAQLSNVLLMATVVVYAIAMLCYACDFAFSPRRLAVSRAAWEPELVSAGAAAMPAGRAPVGEPAPEIVAVSADKPGDSPPRRAGGPRGAWMRAGGPRGAWMRAAFLLTCLGLALHAAGIISRGISEHRVPWGNMYEFITAITCMAVAVLVAVAVRYRAYYLGLFVLIPVVFALGLAVTVIYTPAGALVPALQSYWIAIHVTAMIVATGLFTVGVVVTVLYLLADRYQRRLAAGTASGGIMAHLPSPAVLDRLSYRTILFAFPVWTFGIIAGAIWADQAWGRYWGWDPKETWSFITWVVYAGFLHARATAGWRGRRAAYIHLAGFACLMFNLVGVNLWITGLHSYAGIS
jgi:cytochrome c-type biogenesis protein CcsB